MFERGLFGVGGGVVEVCVSKEGFGGVCADFEEVAFVARELKVGLIDVGEAAFGIKSGCVGGGGGDGDFTSFMILSK